MPFNLPFKCFADQDQGTSHQILCVYLSNRRLLPTASSTQHLNTASGTPPEKQGAWFKSVMPCLNYLVNKRPELASKENDQERGFVEVDEDMVPRTKSKVTMLVEVVLDITGTKQIGYRFWYVVKCTDFDFNLGMANLIKENLEEHTKISKQAARGQNARPLAGEEYKDIHNIDIYMSAIYQNHTAKIYDTTDRGPASFDNLLDPANPLCPSNLFSVQNAFNSMDLQHEATNELQGNVSSYLQMDGGMATKLVFPVQHMVIEIDISVGTSAFITNMQLPKLGTLHIPKNPPSIHAVSEHNRAVQGGNTTRVAADVMDTTSEIKMFADQNAAEYATLRSSDNHESAAAQVEAVNKYRVSKMKDFAYIWGAANHVSDMVKLMFQYHDKNMLSVDDEEDSFLSYSRPLDFCNAIDKHMSPFANMMIRRMDFIQHPYAASTSHLIILFLSIARLDAYRRGLNLHQHFLLTGSGNTGKSYCLNVMGKKMSIPHSVEWLTHKTLKADAVDHHQNDRIVLHHEMPDHLLGINNDQGSATGDYMYKNALDSGVVCTKTFHRDDLTGERTNRYSESECISVNGGATNEPPKNVPDALMQRFSLWMVPEKEIKDGRKIDHFLDPSREVDQSLENQVNKIFQDEQFLVCIVEKLIWVSIIPDVNMDLARSVWRDLEEELAPKGIDLTLTRNMQRVQLLARTLTILNALEMVFHLPSSPVYNKPFEWDHFLKLIPFMVCTEEIAITAITMMSEQYIMSGEEIILRDLADKICRYPPDIDYEGYDAEADMESQPAWKKNKDSMGVVTCDYNFVEVKGTLWGVATQAHKYAGRTKHSIANINLMLWRLEKRKIKARKFTSEYGVREQRATDMPILERSQQSKDTRIFINVHYLKELLEKGMHNVFLEAIQQISTDVTRHRKIITGKSYLDYHHADGNVYTVPDVLQTVRLTPSNKKKILKRKTDKYEPDVVMEEDSEFYVISQFLQRESVCSFEEITENSYFIPSVYETKYTAQQESDVQYPEDRLRDIFHKKQTVSSSSKRKLAAEYGRNVRRLL